MIGRGALGNPWIFRQIKEINAGHPPSSVSITERFDMIRIHYELMLAWKPKHIAVREMRKHIGWYLHGIRGASKARSEICHAEDPAQVWEILNRIQKEAVKENI